MQRMIDLGLQLPEELQVLAEDGQFVHGHGDALCAYVRKLRYRCEPEWYMEVESLDEWLARGGKIIEC